MHHRSPHQSKLSKSPQQLYHERSLSPLEPVDLNLQRSYLSKLRVQREKIQKLYLDYEQSISKIQSLSEQNTLLKQKNIRLENRLGIEDEHKKLLEKYSELQIRQSQSQSQNEQLRLRYEQKFLQNTKKLKQLKEYYNEQLQQLAIQNNVFKDSNRDISAKLQQFKLELSRKRIQFDEKQKIIETLKRQYSELITNHKVEVQNYRYSISERDDEFKRIRLQISMLKEKNQQQSYAMQLEKEKHQQLIQEYVSQISQQKLQIQSLQRQLLVQLQQNNKLIENQQKFMISAKQAKCKIETLHLQLQNYKTTQRVQKQRVQFKQKQERKRLEQRVQLLQQQVKTGNKQFVVLVSRYERLQQLMRKKQMNENAKRELIRYEHQQIDKMDSILKL